MKLRIEVAKKEDIPSLIVLVNNCYRGDESLKGWTSEAGFLDGIRTTPESLEKEMSNENAKILKYTDENGEIIACVYTLKLDGNKLHTGMLCVKPTQQGNGLGRTMMNAVEELAKEENCNCLKIDVITIRDTLIAWYERLGFERTGEVTPFDDFGKGIPKGGVKLMFMGMEKTLF